MKTHFPKSLIALLFVASCHAADSTISVKNWKTYRLEIPNFVVEYKIPPELTLGYGGTRSQITLNDPEKDEFASSLGDGAFSKDVGTFYVGESGDFQNWDSRVNFIVIKFDRKRRLMKSVDDLSQFIREILSQRQVLENGKEVVSLGSVSVNHIGTKNVVIAISADQSHVTNVTLKGGVRTQLVPYQFYYLVVDDGLAIGIRVYHDREKLLSPKWHENSRTMISSIIEEMVIRPVK